VTIFFVSFILIASIVLLNVIVAILLDEFVQSVTREKEQREIADRLATKKKRITGVLDPLTSCLVTFDDETDLCRKIDDIFDRLDINRDEQISFEEFRERIKNLPGAARIHVTRDDFDMIVGVSERGRLWGVSVCFYSD